MKHLILALALLFVASPAFAQTGGGEAAPSSTSSTPSANVDGARFRWAVQLQAGPLIMPVAVATADSSGNTSVENEIFTVGVAGFATELGLQLNDFVGIYSMASLDIIFGDVGGFGLTGSLIADFTILEDMLTIGAGPDASAFIAIGDGDDGNAASGAAGAMYGARIRVNWNGFVSRTPGEAGRTGMIVGLDLRLLTGAVAAASVSEEQADAAGGSDFFFSPMITFGYRGF